MLFQILDPLYTGRWDQIRAVDLGCHEGYFTFSLARRGCREVLGIDGRQSNVDGAQLMRAVLGLSNTRFAVADLMRLDPRELGIFDVTLLLGVLYHVPDPIGLIRLVRALTRGVCLIETQIAPDLSGRIDWGSSQWTIELVGCFGVVDETDAVTADNPTANLTAISLVPSLPGLLYVLKALGFTRTDVVTPPPDAYEQLASGKRVMVAAFAE
jgi:hypothetical protein